MFFKNNIRTIALNICAVSLVALLSLSCTAKMKDGVQASDNQLFAENSMMKKRLPLVERESDVLKKENRQYRTKIQELEAQNKKLSLELTSLNEKYTNDVAIDEEEINYLHELIQRIEKENSERIEELISQKKVLEAKLARDTQALKEEIAAQKSAFVKEREQILQENAKRDLSQTLEINSLKKEIEPKETEISSYKLAINEISLQLGAATALSEALKKSRDKTLAELESVKAASKKNKDESLVELESIKTVNASLHKKMAELSSQLSNQYVPAQTTH